jgi:hypothetical protein
MQQNTTTDIGQPVHELGALTSGDVVRLNERPEPLTVADARLNHACLTGPRGGETVLSDWQSTNTETGEFRTSGGKAAHLWCLERADGTIPEETIGMEVDRDTPTGGLSTAFTRASGGDAE